MNGLLNIRTRRASPRLLLALAAVACCTLAAPRQLLAAWPVNGLAVCTGASGQFQPVIAPDGAGGAFVAWTDGRGSSNLIYLQRVTGDGAIAPGWPANGLAVGAGSGAQDGPDIAADGSGGVLVTWTDNRNSRFDWDIYAQRITASGTVAPGWPAGGLAVCTATDNQVSSRVVADGAGGAILAWGDVRPGSSGSDIYAQRVSGAGVPLWTANGVALCSAADLQLDPKIATDGAGGAIAVWEDRRPVSAEADIYAQRVNGTGAVQWTAGGIAVCSASGVQRYPAIVSDDAGGAIVVWQDKRCEPPPGCDDVYAQRITSAGLVAPGWPANGRTVGAAANGQQYPVLARDGSGGAVVAWLDGRDGTQDGYARRIGAGGGDLTAEVRFCTSCGSTFYGPDPAIAADGAGGAIVVWSKEAQPGEINFYAQHLSGQGQSAWPLMGLEVCTATGMQRYPAVASDGAEGAIFAWEDWRDAGSTSSDIYAARGVAWSNVNVNVTLGGWSSPAVPRNRADAALDDCLLTADLDGNVSDTYLNWAMFLEGPNPFPPVVCKLLMDERTDWGWQVPFGDSTPPAAYVMVNAGPHTIPGGRHSLLSWGDSQEALPESNESDNVWRGQWVWSPLVTAHNTPNVRDEPSVYGYFTAPNGDGLKFVRNPGFAWVVSAAPMVSGEDYDLYVFDDDYAGSTTGFSNLRGSSTYGSTATDFVVGHYAGTPGTILSEAVAYSSSPGFTPGVLATDQSAAYDHNASGEHALWPDQLLTAYRLADIYEAYLISGTEYHFVLSKLMGWDLAFEVFPGIAGGIYSRGQTWPFGTSNPASPEEDTLRYQATITGWHPVVVYRTDGVGAQDEARYQLVWGDPAVAEVLPGGGAPALEFGGARPNPVAGSASLEFTLSREGPVKLALFDPCGRRVRVVVDRVFGAGRHAVAWDGHGDDGARLGAGLYWARLEAEGRSFTRRVTLLR